MFWSKRYIGQIVNGVMFSENNNFIIPKKYNKVSPQSLKSSSHIRSKSKQISTSLGKLNEANTLVLDSRHNIRTSICFPKANIHAFLAWYKVYFLCQMSLGNKCLLLDTVYLCDYFVNYITEANKSTTTQCLKLLNLGDQ